MKQSGQHTGYGDKKRDANIYEIENRKFWLYKKTLESIQFVNVSNNANRPTNWPSKKLKKKKFAIRFVWMWKAVSLKESRVLQVPEKKVLRKIFECKREKQLCGLHWPPLLPVNIWVAFFLRFGLRVHSR